MTLTHRNSLGVIENDLNLLESMVYRAKAALTEVQVVDCAEAIYSAPPNNAAWQNINPERRWGSQNCWTYLRGKAVVPEQWTSGAVDLVLDSQEVYHAPLQMGVTGVAGPEGQVFVGGRRVGAIDTFHRAIRHPFAAGEACEITAVFFAGQLPCSHVLKEFALAWVDVATEKLYYDLRVLLEVAKQLPVDSIDCYRRMEVLRETVRAIDFHEIGNPSSCNSVAQNMCGESFYASVPRAQKVFDELISGIAPSENAPSVVAVGHGHIDLAWLWPIAQTRHKCIRTFATQCRLLDQYDRWVYNQSSPQAYAWVEEDAPDLYDEIRRHVKAGRWEADGAMWCEADTNVPSGESLVRQLLYGKQYFKEKLGVDSRMLWLPDVFGYSACLPQLLKLADVDAFVTSKISWNECNQFPYDSFRWRGMDGTEMPTHFITTPLPLTTCLREGQPNTAIRTYNSVMDMEEIKGCWDVYRQKSLGIDPLLTFGYGDGGGGPTEGMVHTAQRMADLPASSNVPVMKLEPVAELLKRVVRQAHRLPAWDGELYLEFHRGTYTSQGWLKRANRKNEIRLHNVEWLASLLDAPQAFDKEKLDRLWQDLLLCQFHDILPGSSIGPVYDEVRVLQQNIEDAADAMTAGLLDEIGREIDTTGCERPVVVFNTLSWARSDPVQLPNGVWVDDVTVPAGGWTVIDAAVATDASDACALSVSQDARTLTSKFWKLRLDDQGHIVELYDRLNHRQVLPEQAVANAWQLFEDRPVQSNNDAWDVDSHYEDRPLPEPKLQSMAVVESDSVQIAVEFIWHLAKSGGCQPSTITQRLRMYAENPRIDFETDIDWHEHHQLLKVAFPVDVRATEAAYQVQFGHLRRPTHRNTSWDTARFEVCAHQFVDLAEHGYGVSLLNDCKYGHDVHEGVIRLTCIKSAQFPDENADQGRHRFTYSLLPHAGTFQQAGVIRAAAELNTPLIARDVPPAEGKRPAEVAFVCCSNESVIIDTVKQAEDGSGLIVRCYESHGSRGAVALNLAKNFSDVQEVNLLEEPADTGIALTQNNAEVTFHIQPFQIVTLKFHK